MANGPPLKSQIDTDADTIATPSGLSRASDAKPHTAIAKTELASSTPAPRGAPSSRERSQPSPVDASAAPLDDQRFDERYELRGTLGEGGMGEVHLTKDRRVGRDVALKVVRRGHGSSSADVCARFEREARVQGQLEHPSVVPVYDLGVTPDGAAYFTMKRIKGHTLEEIVHRRREGDASAETAFSQRKLLSAFSSVCLAVAFAHSRGVVHRDLKPSNVMLGEFGEVNVLDWGVAKVAGSDDEPLRGAIEAPATGGQETEAGTILGTPGYMSPEQVRGETVDGRADIYALGAILFEIVTLQPLVRGETGQAMLAHTLAGANAAARERAPELDIAPELEAICLRATAFEASARYQTARELYDDLERYLDGARDESRRRELAGRHTVQAQLEMAHARAGGSDADTRRAKAMREVSTALALDPSNDNARATMIRLLTELPEEMPAAAEAELAAKHTLERASAAKASVIGLGAAFLMDPVVTWLGVRSWTAIIVIGAALLWMMGFAYYMGRNRKVSDGYMLAGAAFGAFVVGSSAVLMGPLVMTPVFALGLMLVFVVNMKMRQRHRWAVLGLALLAVTVPLLLQATGVFPQTYSFENGRMIISPWAVSFPAVPTMLLLFASYAVTLSVSTWLMGRTIDRLVDAERRIFLQAHNLRHLLPEEARAAATPPAPAPTDALCRIEKVMG